MKHGRYSTIRHEALRDLIAHHEADPDPLNIFPELAAARALFQDFVERYYEWRAAFLAWHASFSSSLRPDAEAVHAIEVVLDEFEALTDPEERTPNQTASLVAARRALEKLTAPPDAAKPREVMDLSAAMGHLDTISRMIRRVEQTRSDQHISRPEFLRFLTELTRVVELHNNELDPIIRLEKIAHGWATVRLA